MADSTIPNKPSFLERKLVLWITPAHLLLLGIIILSVALHFLNLQAIGDANTYYTAAVKSMLQSWNNFFFVAAEPGGSLTVDKPPLGLWVEAAFALVLGEKGWVVSLPNILAGVFSVPLLYFLVKKYLGELAGLVAALVLVATPVAIATDRNNTMDGMLVFTLLLAAWAFLAATETSKARWLFLGAFLVGLGFNIKMLQAYLPLPAFYAVYLLGSKTGWQRKLFYTAISAIILLVVSLSWVVIVDLTPADQRPYIGSSENNTVLELIVGHNGLSRLFNSRANQGRAQDSANPSMQAPAGNFTDTVIPQNQLPDQGNQQQPSPPQEALDACAIQAQGAACSFNLRNGNEIQGACIEPPGMHQLACAPAGRLPQNGNTPGAMNDLPPNGQAPQQPKPGFQPPAGMFADGPNASPDGPYNSNANAPFSQETGSPGIARFFVYPLSKQMSWLLPFALVSIGLAVFAARLRLPLETEHKALALWGGWLLTCLVFFSVVEGIFHAYYAIMLAPALGAVVGMGMGQLWRWQSRRPGVSAWLVIAAGITITFQIFTANQYGLQTTMLYLPLTLLLASIGLLIVKSLRPVAYLVILVAIMAIPLLWTGMTVLDRAPNTNLPTSIDAGATRQSQLRPAPELNERNTADQDLVAYLQANTQDVEYLVAVSNSHTGSPLVLATGRPVLYIGGFGGNDPVIGASGLQEMVETGQLRYVLFGEGIQGKQEIKRWLQTSCTVVSEFSRRGAGQPPSNNQRDTLYQCGS